LKKEIDQVKAKLDEKEKQRSRGQRPRTEQIRRAAAVNLSRPSRVNYFSSFIPLPLTYCFTL
jgi:threonine/homoserine/homoserine lactone efflux protein